MNALVAAEHVSVVRGDRRILDDVSLRVRERDFITIIGPNGAGKTMLLHGLMGFYKPDHGHIRRKKNLQLAYMPQKIPLDYTMPITALRFLRLRKNSSREDLNEVMDELDISHACSKQLQMLSNGELQRVLLARALLGKPELLVLDEPAQNLDVNGQLAFYKLLEKVYERRVLSILMVSHDLHLVMASTRHVICLFHHICCSGEPQSVARTSEFARLFGNEAARMMAFYHHAHNHRHEGEGERG